MHSLVTTKAKTQQTFQSKDKTTSFVPSNDKEFLSSDENPNPKILGLPSLSHSQESSHTDAAVGSTARVTLCGPAFPENKRGDIPGENWPPVRSLGTVSCL